MTPEENKLMVAIGKRLGVLESEVKELKNSKNAVPIPSKIPSIKPLNASRAANKFFGADTPTEGAKITGDLTVKDEAMLLDSKYQQGLVQAKELFTKAVKEFCQEFDLKEFNIKYTDDSPKK